MGKRLKSFSSHALHGSYTKVKVSDNPTQRDSVAPSKTFTIIFILFSIKVFLLVTKHKPEAIEQQGELRGVLFIVRAGGDIIKVKFMHTKRTNCLTKMKIGIHLEELK